MPNNARLNCAVDTHSSLNKDLLLILCRYSIAGLILFSIALPTGSIVGVPIKHVLYLASLFSLGFLWLRGESLSPHLLFLLVATAAFVLLFSLIGFFKGVTSPVLVIKEAAGVFTAISIVLIVELARKSQWINASFILGAAFWGCFIFALMKSLVALLLALKLFSFPQVHAFFLGTFNYSVVSSMMFGGLARISFIINDFVVVVMLFIVVAYPRSISGVPKIAKYFFLLIGLACLLFAYSRLLFAIFFVLFCFVWLFRWKWKARVVSALIVLFSALYFSQWIEGAFEQRFLANQNDVSDSIRIDGINGLLTEWAEVPIFGGGFGYYAKGYVRDSILTYSYEVQWIGFLAKLGLVGIIYLLSLVALLFIKVMEGPRNIGHYAFLFTLSCFILGGFTNQYLTASASGVLYCIHLAIAEYLRLRSLKCESG